MKKLDYELDVGGVQLSELRPILEQAIHDHFGGGGFLKHRWEGDVLQLSGPGATGSLVAEGGRLKLQAQLKPPASWAHGTIRKKLEASLDDIAAAFRPSGG